MGHKRDVTSLWESLYFSGLLLFVLCHLTKNAYCEFPDLLSSALKIISMSIIFTHILVTIHKWNKKMQFVFFVVETLAIVTAINTQSGFSHILLLMPMLIFGANDIKLSKIIYYVFLINLTFFITVILCSLIGLLEDRHIEAYGRESFLEDFSGIRHSFGYCWPTNLANHVFYILLLFWVIKNGILTKFQYIIYIFASYFIILFTDSRLSASCILLIVVISLFFSLYKKNPILSHPKLTFCFVFSIPFFCVISLYVAFAYDPLSPFWALLNVLLSNRLTISQEAILNDGIPPFGQPYILEGGDMAGDFYNYIDNAYIQNMIIWGWIYSFLFYIAYFVACKKYHKLGDVAMLFGVFVAGLSGLIAQHFSELFVNPLILGLFAMDSNKINK